MVELKKKGYTYGMSYEGMLYWKLNTYGVGICIHTRAKEINLIYTCAENTFRERNAKLCSKKDFEDAFITHILPNIPKDLKDLINTKVKRIK